MIQRFLSYRLSICCLVLLWAFTAQAQSNFLYIQSENNQPYFIQLKGNTYGSTGKGYLFIPQLPNGSHSITISFPGEQYGEYTFNFTVADKPKGFALRITQEGEWMLMDMVSNELLKGMVSGQPMVTNSQKQIQKIAEKSNEVGVDQKYAVINGRKTDTIQVFIPAVSASAPIIANGTAVRVAQKSGNTKPQATKQPSKIKVPLVPEAYGSGTPKKSGKQ